MTRLCFSCGKVPDGGGGALPPKFCRHCGTRIEPNTAVSGVAETVPVPTVPFPTQPTPASQLPTQPQPSAFNKTMALAGAPGLALPAHLNPASTTQPVPAVPQIQHVPAVHTTEPVAAANPAPAPTTQPIVALPNEPSPKAEQSLMNRTALGIPTMPVQEMIDDARKEAARRSALHPEPAASPKQVVQPNSGATILGMQSPVARMTPLPPLAAINAPAPSFDLSADLPPDAAPPSKRGAFVAMAFLGASLAALGLYVFSRAPAVTVSYVADRENDRHLLVECKQCTEGSSVEVDDRSATLANGSAKLALDPFAKGADLGSKTVSVVVHSRFRKHRVEQSVRKDYIIKFGSDRRGETFEPFVEWRVASDVVLEVGGKTAVLTEGVHRVSNVPNKEPIQFTVTGNGRTTSGSIVPHFQRVPLSMGSPPVWATKRASYWISGVTKKGATVKINGSDVPVDPSGAFAKEVPTEKDEKAFEVLVQSASEHEIPVVASTRVRPIRPFSTEKAQCKGPSTLLAGAIVAVADHDHVSSVAMKSAHCKGCLVRVNLGEESPKKEGQPLLACGVRAGSITFQGQDVEQWNAIWAQ
ncbi:MAG: hypothetical protein KBF88_02930 [Polyangiaceae bacterium]|nr:hypothetical protein [Polyangiaceae bacterium]